MSEQVGVRVRRAARPAVRILAATMGSLFVLPLAAVPKAPAAPGDLDPSFSRDGKVVAYADYFAREPGIGGIALQADGSIIAAGDVGLVRFNPVGTVDDSFTSDPDRSLTDVALQPDGKIVGAVENDVFGRLSANGDQVALTTRKMVRDLSGDGSHRSSKSPRSVERRSRSNRTARPLSWGTRALGPGMTLTLHSRYNPNGTPDTSFSGDGRADRQLRRTGHEALRVDRIARSVAGSPAGEIVCAATTRMRLDVASSGEAGRGGYPDPARPGDHEASTQTEDRRRRGNAAIRPAPSPGPASSRMGL